MPMQFYPIETHSWVAIDLIDHHRANWVDRHQSRSKSLASYVCRQLLQRLQLQINLTGELIETALPYFFETDTQQRWYVSFSHSRQHVAVLISHYPHIGIDIEDGNVNAAVAQRFFSSHECEWIASQPAFMQSQLRGLLWRLKECYIKTEQSNNTQLINALKKNILEVLSSQTLNQLVQTNALTNAPKLIYLITHHQHIIGAFQTLPCSFVIKKA